MELLMEELKDFQSIERPFLVKVFKLLDTKEGNGGKGALYGLKALNIIIKDTLSCTEWTESRMELLLSLLNRIISTALQKEHLLNLKLYDLEKLFSNLANRFLEKKEYMIALDILEFIISRLTVSLRKTTQKNLNLSKGKGCPNSIQLKAQNLMSISFKKQKTIDKNSLIVTVWTNIIRIWILAGGKIDYKVFVLIKILEA